MSVFFDITKGDDFQGKKADASRTYGVYLVINLFFRPFLGKVQLCQVSSLEDTCDRFQERKRFCSPSVSSPKKTHPKIASFMLLILQTLDSSVCSYSSARRSYSASYLSQTLNNDTGFSISLTVKSLKNNFICCYCTERETSRK